MSRLIYAIAYTKNLDSMCEFYRDQVGLRIRRQEPQWVELDTGGAILALHETRDEGQEGLALRFETDDLEAYQRALAARGVPPRVPVEAPIGRLVDLRDSEGNRLQILEPHRPVPAGAGPAIERVILNVGGFTRAVSFYRGAIGCRVESEAPHWVEFDAGETLLAVHHRPSGGDPPRHAQH